MLPLKGGLYACEDANVWKKVFDIYQDVIKAKGKKQKKLQALDEWYQKELPASVRSRTDKYLTHDELVKLMEWKLTRGKFRPRLQQMVTSNPRETVETCTKKAFQLLPDVGAAITELSQLKAIGPATASAVLTAGCPEMTAFMADEALQSIPGLTPIQYTLKHYLLYLDKINSCCSKLNKAGAGVEWTPHLVELCLWAWVMAEKLCPELLETLVSGAVEGGLDNCVDKRPAKKIRTK
ncbi:uncharacterized protein [Pleurodeles waltl]